ncbi:MAG TPA: hypothetical protein VGO68_12520 [Pyrinomonadaceae bacterium]|jgi:hypothetical protein|nr:hypothetical protein [Pyrinomonadaceae bacterium]
MLRLLTLRLSIAVWKRSLAISKKLRVRTWIALAAIHACLAIGLFWAYQAKSVPESAIPPVYHAKVQPVPLPAVKAELEFAWSHEALIVSPGQAMSWTGADCPSFALLSFDRGHMTPTDRISWSAMSILAHEYAHDFTEDKHTPYSSRAFLIGTDFVMGGSPSRWTAGSDLDAHLLSAELARGSRTVFFYAGHGVALRDTALTLDFQVNPSRLPIKLPDFGRTVVVQAPSYDRPYLFESVERWRIFICGVIATLAALVYLFFAWEKRKREKAEAVLTALQIEKVRLEVALLKQQWEKAEQETQKSEIILLS